MEDLVQAAPLLSAGRGLLYHGGPDFSGAWTKTIGHGGGSLHDRQRLDLLAVRCAQVPEVKIGFLDQTCYNWRASGLNTTGRW